MHVFRYIGAGVIVLCLHGPSFAEEPPDFSTDVRPILADTCFNCHGPDAAQRKADLRLDRFDDATASAIVPGDASASEFIHRITTTDPDDRMPPPDEPLQLTPEQIETLREWIDAGAEYEKHWAFETIQRPMVPGIADDAGWQRNPIDAFVLRRLQQESLTPAPEADREMLLRRVTLDLTGLPPTLEEIDAFLQDDATDAYARVVDRLLASEAYGEHLARGWLDAARYADTYGYQSDRENYVWPWREWVIRAFNDNLPYDEFLTWQIAGDLLPDATQDQRLATAFNRLHRQTNEGGSTLEEFRVEYVADRTHTFGTAMLGLTMECARCHDHKFDPISQREYYELSAFFDDIDESGMYSHFTDPIPSPSLLLYKEGEEERHADLRKAIGSREAAVAREVSNAKEAYDAWRMDTGREIVLPSPVIDLGLDEISEGKLENRADAKKPGALSQAPKSIPGKVGGAVHFDGDNGVNVNGTRNFERTEPFSIALWLRAVKHVPHAVVAHHTKAAEDAASRGYEILLRDGHPVFSVVHFWPGNAIRVKAVDTIAEGEWVHLVATYDGSSRAEGARIYINGAAVDTEVIRDGLNQTIRYGDDPPLSLASRFRDIGFKDGAIDEFQIYDIALTPLEVRHVAGFIDFSAELAGADSLLASEELFSYYTARIDAEVTKAREALARARERESKFIEGVTEIMAMEDLPQPRQAYLLARGAYTDRTDPVFPDTPEATLPFDGLPTNRLGLARWLTSPENPLTARVAVNRLWQTVFGRGIVGTPEDFGTQGQPPSHPELLDWLASEYIASGWDTKAMLKLIVTSATYRQDSVASAVLRERDPANALLARGPKQRLSAEQVRDSALAASGLLVEKIGGPSVKPYQPPGLWEAVSGAKYEPSKGAGLYRRSLYTFWKRTMPPPSMLTFDAVDRESCMVRRETTATPLQALVLLNDPQFVEAARVLAEKTLGTSEGDAERLEAMFRSLLGRGPNAEELAILSEAHAEQRAHFAAYPEAAAAYAGAGEAPRSEDLDPVDLAAATAIAQAIMNFEEFQVKL